VEKRSGLERELEALDKDIESKRRMLELVEATEEQLAAQGGGSQPRGGWTGGEHAGEGLSQAAVRTSAKRPCGPPGACVRAVTAHASGSPQAVPIPSSSPDAEPQPLPTRALPMAVWEDHLLPLLTCKDAARLGCTCKALRGVVREHFSGDLGGSTWRSCRRR
jgi:hypothetical protein